jgi:hypothetical protein
LEARPFGPAATGGAADRTNQRDLPAQEVGAHLERDLTELA